MSDVVYELVTKENLAKVAAAGAKWGMPRSPGWLRRVLYDPTVSDMTEDLCRGRLVLNKQNSEVVAMLCYFYIPVYFKQKKILAHSGCILGADRRFSEEIFVINNLNNKATANSAIFFGNDAANGKSEKVSRFMKNAQPPPVGGDYLYVRSANICLYPKLLLRRLFKGHNAFVKYLIRGGDIFSDVVFYPAQLLRRIWYRFSIACAGCKTVRVKSIDEKSFGNFWESYLESNQGLVTSRELGRLKWLFEESVKAEKVFALTMHKGNKMVGYAMVRKKLNDSISSYEIVDICALQNNVKYLKLLVRGVCNMVATLGGMKIFYYCFMPNVDTWFLGVRRKQDHSSFLYRIDYPVIRDSINQGDGWFFGPLDGERCMGYGGYIDL